MLIETIRTYVESLPGTLSEKRGLFTIEVLVAERKAFLSRKTLTYRAKFRIDEDARELRFTEALVESGSGMSGGDAGIGFGTETYRSGGKARKGTIDEQSVLSGKRYDVQFDYAKVRSFIEQQARESGYDFKLQLMARGL